nr:SPOR domain-containing protein [Xylanibacterium ulmi]
MSPEYWFNTRTGEVEQGRQSSWSHLMGPYPTREEAARALDSARRRSDAWDQEDADWADGGDDAGRRA